MERSLASQSIECAQLFDTLSQVLRNTSAPPLHHAAVEDQYARFKIWAWNLGAFHRLPSETSLDYRLRYSRRIADHVQSLLLDLLAALRDVSAIASGRRQNRKAGVGIEEAGELFEMTKSTISNLFRIAVLIRKASPRDRFSRALAAANSFDATFDIRHVHDKFPQIRREGNDWLGDRLGSAITQRRQYLSYARSHRDKLGEESTELLQHHEPSALEETRSRAQTKASTLHSALIPPQLDFDDSLSAASSTLSLLEDSDESHLRPPSLSTVSNDEITFECPFCCSMQTFRKESSWQRHVYADLRTYVCTFADCSSTLFEDQRGWFEHECEKHRSQWYCSICHVKHMKTEGAFRDHILTHASNVTEDQLNALSRAARHPPGQFRALDCPFCTAWDKRLRDEDPDQEVPSVTPTEFMKHVGSHMRQLALFALPREYVEEAEDASASSDETNVEIEGTPKFMFRIDEICEDSAAPIDVNNTGNWEPPTDLGANIRCGGGISGRYWLCGSQRIHPFSETLPTGAKLYSTISMYYCDGYGFWIIGGDATARNDLPWRPLTFYHDNKDYSSRLTLAGEAGTLLCQRPDQEWPRMLLPDIYHPSLTLETHRNYGGLNGDLALFLALIAFSMSKEHLEEYVGAMYSRGQWQVHTLPHGRIHRRGVVVYVYTHPQGMASRDIFRYENGQYGHYYN